MTARVRGMVALSVPRDHRQSAVGNCDRLHRALRALHMSALLLMAGFLPIAGEAGSIAGLAETGEVLGPGPMFTEYTLPSFGFHIAAGPGGFWFTEQGLNRIARFNPADGQFTEYSIPTANSTPSVITACPDGNLWFTEQSANQLGRCTPTGSIDEFAVPTPNGRPFGIACDRDRSDSHTIVWFTEASGNNIGRIDVYLDRQDFAEFPVPTAMSTPAFVALGRDGKVWFTEATAAQIGKLDPLSGQIVEFRVPTLSILNGLTSGPDGKLWFTEYFFGNNVASLNPADGAITEYLIPTPNSGAFNCVAAADGNLYFTEQMGNKLGRLNLLTFAIDEFDFPPGSGPSGLATIVRSRQSGARLGVGARPELVVLHPDRNRLLFARLDRSELAFEKFAVTNPVHRGEVMRYLFTVTNNRPDTLFFEIVDEVPAEIFPFPDQEDWINPPVKDVRFWWTNLIILPAGDFRQVEFQGTARGEPGPVENKAMLYGYGEGLLAEVTIVSQIIP